MAPVFLRWVRVHGRNPHAPGGSKDTLRLFSFPLKMGASSGDDLSLSGQPSEAQRYRYQPQDVNAISPQ